jgi:hypothetical protein
MKAFISIALVTILILAGCKKAPLAPTSHSNTYPANSWNWDSINKFRYVSFADPDISPAKISSGSVRVSILMGGQFWNDLPQMMTMGSVKVNYSFKAKPGNVEIDVQASDNSDPAPKNYSFQVTAANK